MTTTTLQEVRGTLQFILDAYARIELADWDGETVADELQDLRGQAVALLARLEEEEEATR